jgi:outer membrane protein, multidrug efflux system
MTYIQRPLTLLTMLSVLALTSCAISPLAKYLPTAPPAAWIEPLPFKQAHDGKLTDLKNWWQQFNDPVLLQLIEAAQKVSPDIESAKARVIAAQAAVTLTEGQLLPSLTADASASRNQNGVAFPVGNTANIGLNTSWELDVWGKNKSDKNEKQAQLSGSSALWHEARVIVAAQTATQYLDYRLCENLSNISKKNMDSNAETARLTNLSANAGFLAPASASQALAIAAEASNQFKKQTLQCTLMLKSLVALTAIPESDLRIALATNTGMIPTPSNISVSQIPANLLVQRPDVLNAERNVAAAGFEVTVSQALRYPRLSLAGNIGLTYDNTMRNFAPRTSGKVRDGVTWSIGPVAVSLPIFDAGVRVANITAAKAQYEAAKNTYESVARNAVREVEEAMAKLNSTSQRLEDVNKAADGFKISLAATQMRYQASLANLFELEDSRRADLQAQTNVVTLTNERVLAWISLYRAMGGGWTQALNSPDQILDHELKQTELPNLELTP